LVDKVVMPMKYSAKTTLLLGGDASLDHVFFHPIQSVVEEMVTLMQYSTDPSLLLESDKSKEVISMMQYSTNPTLLLGIDVSFENVLNISSSVPFG
jgi:hypothetical protein